MHESPGRVIPGGKLQALLCVRNSRTLGVPESSPPPKPFPDEKGRGKRKRARLAGMRRLSGLHIVARCVYLYGGKGRGRDRGHVSGTRELLLPECSHVLQQTGRYIYAQLTKT